MQQSRPPLASDPKSTRERRIAIGQRSVR
jgi:hypothetical protein